MFLFYGRNFYLNESNVFIKETFSQTWFKFDLSLLLEFLGIFWLVKYSRFRVEVIFLGKRGFGRINLNLNYHCFLILKRTFSVIEYSYLHVKIFIRVVVFAGSRNFPKSGLSFIYHYVLFLNWPQPH